MSSSLQISLSRPLSHSHSPSSRVGPAIEARFCASPIDEVRRAISTGGERRREVAVQWPSWWGLWPEWPVWPAGPWPGQSRVSLSLALSARRAITGREDGKRPPRRRQFRGRKRAASAVEARRSGVRREAMEQIRWRLCPACCTTYPGAVGRMPNSISDPPGPTSPNPANAIPSHARLDDERPAVMRKRRHQTRWQQ